MAKGEVGGVVLHERDGLAVRGCPTLDPFDGAPASTDLRQDERNKGEVSISVRLGCRMAADVWQISLFDDLRRGDL